MGTNYYACLNFCEHCKRPAKRIHIGKRSGGWAFTFRSYPEPMDDDDAPRVQSYQDWLRVLSSADTVIDDEYGTSIALEALRVIVAGTMKAPRNRMSDYTKENHPEIAKQYWRDAEGYEFCEGEFS